MKVRRKVRNRNISRVVCKNRAKRRLAPSVQILIGTSTLSQQTFTKLITPELNFGLRRSIVVSVP